MSVKCFAANKERGGRGNAFKVVKTIVDISATYNPSLSILFGHLYRTCTCKYFCVRETFFIKTVTNNGENIKMKCFCNNCVQRCDIYVPIRSVSF